MSLEKLRVGNLTKTSLVRECGDYEDVNAAIEMMQDLQKYGNYLNPRDLLNDPLLNVDRKMAQCILHHANTDSMIPLPILFHALTPKESALGEAVAAKPLVENLNRTPVATMRVCGWEADPWFKDGQTFFSFWNRLHPESLPCIPDLDPDEKLVAVLYASLQGIRSLLDDLVSILETIKEDEKTRSVIFLSYREAYKASVDSFIFLCPIFRNFCKVLRDSLESAWRLTEFLKLKADVSEYQRVLRNAAFFLDVFYESLKTSNACALAWVCDIKSTEVNDIKLLEAVASSLTSLENLNRSLTCSASDPFFDRAIKKIQKSFQGMSIVALPTKESITDAGS